MYKCELQCPCLDCTCIMYVQLNLSFLNITALAVLRRFCFYSQCVCWVSHSTPLSTHQHPGTQSTSPPIHQMILQPHHYPSMAEPLWTVTALEYLLPYKGGNKSETERGPEYSCKINTQGYMYLRWSLYMYLVFTRMPGESYHKRLRCLFSLFLC